jgi:hypothetical protein
MIPNPDNWEDPSNWLAGVTDAASSFGFYSHQGVTLSIVTPYSAHATVERVAVSAGTRPSRANTMVKVTLNLRRLQEFLPKIRLYSIVHRTEVAYASEWLELRYENNTVPVDPYVAERMDEIEAWFLKRRGSRWRNEIPDYHEPPIPEYWPPYLAGVLDAKPQVRTRDGFRLDKLHPLISRWILDKFNLVGLPSFRGALLLPEQHYQALLEEAAPWRLEQTRENTG